MGRNEMPDRLQERPAASGKGPAAAGAPDHAVTLHVNGLTHLLPVPPGASLLGVLRNDLGLNGPKYGCGLGQCGACTVLVDGIAARACVIPVGGVRGRRITTLEGLGDARAPHPVQQAFIDAQAAQCGYCLNGMIMATAALLAETPRPSEAQARQALAGNLCRCGAHVEIVQAVMRAAELLAGSRGGVREQPARPARPPEGANSLSERSPEVLRVRQ